MNVITSCHNSAFEYIEKGSIDEFSNPLSDGVNVTDTLDTYVGAFVGCVVGKAIRHISGLNSGIIGSCDNKSGVVF